MAQQFKLRMPEKMREAIDQACRETGASLNAEIVQRLGNRCTPSACSAAGRWCG